MRVKAKRMGWNEQLTPEQQLDSDVYDDDDDDLEGELQVVEGFVPGVGRIEVHLVNGQEADPESVEEL